MARDQSYAHLETAIKRGNIETKRGRSKGLTNPKTGFNIKDFISNKNLPCNITFTTDRLPDIEKTAVVRFRKKGDTVVVDYWLKDVHRWWRAFEGTENQAHYLLYDKKNRPCIKTTLDNLIITSCVYSD